MERDPRRAVRKPQCPQDWEEQKAVIEELWVRMRMELKDLMRVMEQEHFFKATENQYKKKFRKWNLPPKHFKDREYRAIISKKRERERSGKTLSSFRLRGAEVKDSAITRFQKRKDILDVDVLPEIATPSDLSCYTPASTARSRSHSPAESSNTFVPTREFKEFVDRTGLSSVQQSPRLSTWFEDSINRSAVGTPTIHSDPINGFFQYFESPIDVYEQRHQLSSIITDVKYAYSINGCPNPCYLATAGLTRACKLMAYDRKQAQGLLALVFSDFREAFRTARSAWSVGALIVACGIYIATGRANTAVTILESLNPLIEQDPELVKENLYTRSKLILEFVYNIGSYYEAGLEKVLLLQMHSLSLSLNLFSDGCEQTVASISKRFPKKDSYTYRICELLEDPLRAVLAIIHIQECLLATEALSRADSGKIPLSLMPCQDTGYDRTGSQYATPEQPEAYDPCLTEAARWEELE